MFLPYGFCLKLIVLLFLMQMVSWCYNRTFIATHTGLINVMYEYEMKFCACLNLIIFIVNPLTGEFILTAYDIHLKNS